MPFFSIIIPTFNRAHTIRRPIDSILAQTFIDWELIIVDDGSTDDTKEIIESYEHPRIRYVWQENQERSAARNHGISLAKGEWICFQDSDDEYLPEHLDVLYYGIVTNNDFYIFRTAYILSIKGEQHYCNHYPAGRYDSSPYDSFLSFTFSAKIIQDFAFDERFFIAEDLHFLLKVGQKHKIFIIEKHTVLIYHISESSGGIGIKYYNNLTNQKSCLEDILTWNKTMVIPYIVRIRCLNEILMLFGNLKFKKRLIYKAMKDNLKVFFRFPLEYIKLVIRIVYVKIGEFSGFYQTRGRF